MLTLFLLLSALGSSTSAPLSIPTDGTNSVPIVLFGRQLPQYINIARYRTLQDIVWSCLVTIFACTWVAVHPNIPGPYDSKWTRLKRKVTIMVYAILAPELMTMWAMRQWFEARKIVKELNQRTYPRVGSSHWNSIRDSIREFFREGPQNATKEWTLTHGFFLQMGGFILYDGEVPACVLGLEGLQRFMDEGKVDLPSIKEIEIEDKSKGDLLTKLFVVIQTTWFVVQCIARWTSHLPVTELEVVTLAFAMLNIITYGLWWKKPQNVLVAVTVPMKHGAAGDPPPGVEVGVQEAGAITVPTNDNAGLAGVEKKGSWVTEKVEEARKSRWWFISVPRRLFQAFIRPFKKLAGLTRHALPHGSLRVSMFQVEDVNEYRGLEFIGDDDDEAKADFPILIIGILFGGLHLIPWSSNFPTSAERSLWHTSALVLTIEPALLFFYSLMVRGSWDIGHWLKETIFFIVYGLALLGVPVYLLARLTLLVLAFTTLRELPPEAYANIGWTTFVPHI